MKTVWKALAVAAGLAFSVGFGAGAATAQSVTDIVKRGKVKIGVLIGAPPYGSVDAHGNAIGYDTDVARDRKVSRRAGRAGRLTPPARIPALEAGKVDFLVATLAPTPERAKAVMFTIPYSAFQIGIYAKKSDNIKSWADLKGKKVGVNRGSSLEPSPPREKAEGGYEILRFEDDATVMQALFSGQVDAVASPDAQANAAMKARNDTDVRAEVRLRHAAELDDRAQGRLRAASVAQQHDLLHEAQRRARRDLAEVGRRRRCPNCRPSDRPALDRLAGAAPIRASAGDCPRRRTSCRSSSSSDPIFAEWPMILDGVMLTIVLSFGGDRARLVPRDPAVGRSVDAGRWARMLVDVYVELLRNTPFLVQLFMIFFGLPAARHPADGVRGGPARDDAESRRLRDRDHPRRRRVRSTSRRSRPATRSALTRARSSSTSCWCRPSRKSGRRCRASSS